MIHLRKIVTCARSRKFKSTVGSYNRFGAEGLVSGPVHYKAIFKLVWDIGPSARLASTTGYVSYEQKRKDDFDGTIVAESHMPITRLDASQASQELTLTADLSDRLDVILGAFYLQADVKHPVVLGLPLLDLPVGALDLRPDQDLTSYAAYTQWRYRLTDNFRVSVGARYTYDEKDYFEEDIVSGASSVLTGSESWDAFTPRLAIDYTPTDDLTVYASVSRGFKAGGFNTFGTLGGAPNDFEPEFVWSYEVGLKASWFERRLRTGFSGFYMDYTDLQQSLLRTPEGGGVPVQAVQNAASATVAGVEFEVEAFISEAFRLVAAGTWLDATFDELRSIDQVFPELGERDLAGNHIPRAPEWQFNISAQYTVPLGMDWQGVLRTDYVWQDRVFFSYFNHDLNGQEAYGLLNLSVALETGDGRWQLLAFADNVLDERYVIGGYVQDVGGGNQRYGDVGAPRMYGVSLAYYF